MKKIILVFILFFSAIHGFSQKYPQNTSILGIISALNNDTLATDSLLSICREKWKYAQFTEARMYADAALLLAEKARYKNGVAEANNQVGIVYWYIKEYDNALNYHLKAMELFKAINNAKGISSAYNRIGHAYADMPEYDKALEYFQKALTLDESLHDTLGIAKNLNLVGFVYMRSGDFKNALDHYNRSLSLSEILKSQRGISAVNHDIGEIYEKQNLPDKALPFALKGLELALKVGENKLIEEAYSGLEKIYLRKKDFEKAYETRVKLDEVAAVEKNANQAGTIKQMQMEYEFEKKQAEERLLFEKQKEIEDVKLNDQKKLTYTAFGGSILALLLLIFIFRSYRQQRVVNQKLKNAQEQLVKNETMVAYGVMASKVSHEILNPLNFVNNLSETTASLTDELLTSSDASHQKEVAHLIKESVSKINEHGKRASDIINQLQKHSEKGTAHEFFEDK